MAGVATCWRTIRHLKLRQIAGRAWLSMGVPVPRNRPAPARRAAIEAWTTPARRLPGMLGPARFRFLNAEHSIEETGWDAAAVDRLWRYNLHYFDDLNAFDAPSRDAWHVALVERWIRENPPARGTGWEPYPCSLRIVNWIKWMLARGHAEAAWLDSLARQVRWLGRRIEWHLLGNHLFANAKALFIAGMYFDGAAADAWRSRAVRILARELREQVLADGAQFELTPMYHRLALQDVLDLLLVIRVFGEPDPSVGRLGVQLQECAARMLAWAEAMQFADGSLPRFNDSADGIAPDRDELLRVAGALRISTAWDVRAPVQWHEASGYVRMQWDGALAFLDVAAVGPDYLPGHAHADTLSFELSLQGRLLVVNRGTSCYGASARRAWERSTAAHSTVEVLGRDSSETWGGFRVGRRARPHDLAVGDRKVSCEHDGYRFLPGRPRHRRTWERIGRGLLVSDELGADYPAVVRYHLAPGLQARHVSGSRWQVWEQQLPVADLEVSGGAVRLVRTQHATGFGQLVPATTIEIDLVAGRTATRWTW